MIIMEGKKIQAVDGGFLFFCPGCGNAHMVDTVLGQQPYWTWNGFYDRPTISPSYLINIPASTGGDGEDWPLLRCHSYIQDGRIQYLSDSTHHLSGQTVDLPDWEE